MSAKYTFDVQPGQLIAIFFVVFDLIMLNLADFFLTRVACFFYYRQIYKGDPIQVNAKNVPFVTTFLVGDFKSPINLIATMAKLGLIYIVLMLDSDPTVAKRELKTSGSFYFDPTGNGSRCGGYTRQWSYLASCSHSEGDSMTIHKYVFDLIEKDYTTPTECILGQDLKQVDGSTLKCLSKSLEKASDSDTKAEIQLPQNLTKIIGCSPVKSHDCSNSEKQSTTEFKLYSAKNVEGNNNIADDAAVGSFRFKVQNLVPKPEKLLDVWPEYNNISMLCSEVQFSVSTKETNESTTLVSCMLSAKVNGMRGTLVEIWYYNKDTLRFTRNHPGPIFEDEFILSKEIMSWIIIQYGRTSQLNWKELAVQVTNRALLYKAENITFTTGYGNATRTSIGIAPFYTAVGALVLCFVLFLFSVCFLPIGGPKFNTVEGMLELLKDNHGVKRGSNVGKIGVIPLSNDGSGQLLFGVKGDLGREGLRQRTVENIDITINKNLKNPKAGSNSILNDSTTSIVPEQFKEIDL